MLRDVRESIVMLAEDVGQVNKNAAIGKRVDCIRLVDECDFREVSVVNANKKYSGIDCRAINNYNERTTGHRAAVQGLTYIVKNKMECISP